MDDEAKIDRVPSAGGGCGNAQAGRAMAGEYLLLYNYLENRYANTVVLTFAQIEDLLGFVLPEQARLHQEWWTNATEPCRTQLLRFLDPGPTNGDAEPGRPDRGV